MLGVVLLFVAVDFNLFWLFGSSPSLENLQRPELARASEVYSADGVLLGRYFRENRSPVDYKDISPYLTKALLATEDVRFEAHSGIDPVATVSIFYYLAKGDNRGGSTLTQQLAKNLFKTRRGTSTKGLLAKVPLLSTLIAKMKEWITAIKLEKSYTKEEILTMYFNTVDFGSNSYGIKAAAKTFFSTTPANLKVEECAVLVGMLKATTLYNPKRSIEKATQRRNTVLSQMAKYAIISHRQLDSLERLPIALKLTREEHSDGPLDYYNQTLTDYLLKWGKQNNVDIYGDGLRIYTTIDTRYQRYAREAMQEHMSALQRRFNGHVGSKPAWIDEKGNEIAGFLQYHMKKTDHYKQAMLRFGGRADSVEAYLNRPKAMEIFAWKDGQPVMEPREMSPYDSLAYHKKLLQAGFMCMDPFTGQIKAWIGGLDYGRFKYDHVKQSKRQPGSTFKAFVYAAAIDQGKSPCDRVQDRQLNAKYEEVENGVVVERVFNPTNATKFYSGINMTLRYAIGRSINSVAAQVTEQLGAGMPATERERVRPEMQKLGFRGEADILYGAWMVAEYAHRCGVKSYLKPVPSIGLGANDVNLHEMVASFSTFLNEGFYTEPILVSRIEDESKNVIQQFTAKTRRALSAETAWLMIHMLKGTLQEPQGTAQALFSYNLFRGNDMAGKTGTSQNQSDGWFIGLSKNLVAGAWVGAEERSVHFRTLRAGEGSKTALPIYGLFMEKVYEDRSLGISMGYFPRAKVKIKKSYLCRTYIPAPKVADDSTATDGPSPTDSLQ